MRASTWRRSSAATLRPRRRRGRRRDVDTAVADEYAEALQEWLDAPSTLRAREAVCCKQARSVAFFEARLFLRGAYKAPCRLLERLSGEAAAAMARMDTWVVQGTSDAVCPEEFARELVAQMRAIRDALEQSLDGAKGAGLLSTHFVDAGHKAGAAGIKEKLSSSACTTIWSGRAAAAERISNCTCTCVAPGQDVIVWILLSGCVASTTV